MNAQLVSAKLIEIENDLSMHKKLHTEENCKNCQFYNVCPYEVEIMENMALILRGLMDYKTISDDIISFRECKCMGNANAARECKCMGNANAA